MFDPVDPKQALPNLEEGIGQYWREEDMFKRSMRQRKSSSDDVLDKPGSGPGPGSKAGGNFSFYDGPPFATGLPHYGHILAGVEKDVIPRYRTMRGDYVQRRFGWDCHGLPVENLVEKEENVSTKQEIEEKGIAWFNDKCRASVLRYTSEWKQAVERMGRWVDMDWDYKTMDPPYMESIWWVFAQIEQKGLLYEGHKAMHICPRCATPLSNFEVTLGYADREDMSTIATFPLVEDPSTVILAWTTTTWSLPGDLWLGFGAEIEYAKVKLEGDDKTYIVAKKLVEDVFKGKEHEVVGSIDPHSLVGKKYVPLFDYYVDTVMPSTIESGNPKTFGEAAFYCIIHPEVAEEEGTGIVHFANSNAEDGFLIAKDEGVDLLHYFGPDGTFHPEVTDFAGMQIKPHEGDPMATDKVIIEKLKEMGRWFSSYTFKHSYPHCWRCDNPLMNYVGSSWFVAVEKMKDRLLANNEKTRWVPDHIRTGRFGRWLENAHDWAISRNRYWGTPLPIWRTDDGNDLTVIGSRDELMNQKKIRFTKVTALRHAESVGNTIPIYQGKEPGTDLTKKGKKDAKAVASRLSSQLTVQSSQLPSVIYCSPLARTKQTAEVFAKQFGCEVIEDERLREVSFGEYEGKTIDFSDLAFLKERRKHKFETQKPESIYHFDGMETWAQVHDRIEDFMNEILPRHRSEHVLIVTHADPVQNIKAFFTGEDPLKLSHQPYPQYLQPLSFFWDHDRQAQMDLHKDNIDDIVWPGSPSEKSVELTLVRHGQTDVNKRNGAQGHADNPLNATGREQAKEQAKNLMGQDFDIVISSDLSRAVETATIITEVIGSKAEHLKWPELRERANGDWDGMPVLDVLEEAPGINGYHGTNFHHLTGPGKAETLSEFLARVESACLRIEHEFPGKRVLLVSHGGTTRAILTLIENRSYLQAAFQEVENAQGTSVTLNPLLHRIPDVLDCWFESGSMPYAQDHYPFELRHHGSGSGRGFGSGKRFGPGPGPGPDFPPGFPADFIAENLDQTRGWFYTLMVLSTALFDEPAFQNCICGGIILAEDGKKMSKRLKNYPDPSEIFDKYGADALRFTLMSSPVVRAETLRFSEKAVAESMQKVLLPLWNVYSFFVTYANAAGFEPTGSRRHSSHPLDQWIHAEVQDLCNRMTAELDAYDLSATCGELHETIDALTNWYVRLSRRRFAGKSDLQDRDDALHTLYDVLMTISQLLAPFCPFITEAIYINLSQEEHDSVHLSDWPEARDLHDHEEELLKKNRLMRLIVSLGNAVRGEQKIKTRQPLLEATIAVPPALAGVSFTDEDLHLLRQELNVKELQFADDPESLATPIAKVDARTVGPRLGGRVQEVIKAGKDGEFVINDNGSITILDETMSPDEVEIVYQGKEGEGIQADKGVVVSLNTEVSEELLCEGTARDIIRAVQRLRKDSGLEFTDAIVLAIEGADDVLESFGEMISEETRATLGANSGEKHTVDDVVIQFQKSS